MTNFKSVVQLGDLMVTSGLISEEQLNMGLLGIHETGLPLGLQLILQNAIDFDTLQALIVAQSMVRDELVTREVASKAIALSKRKSIPLSIALDLLGVQVDNSLKNRLGTLLVDCEIVDRRLLKSRLKISKATGLPLGKVFVAAGDLGVELIDKAILAQKLIRTGEAERVDALNSIISAKSSTEPVTSAGQDLLVFNSRLGRILVDVGLADSTEMEKSAQEAARHHKLLGAFLVENHLIVQESVDIALEIQRLIRLKKFSYVHGINMLRRIHAFDLFPSQSDRGARDQESCRLGFMQFLRLVRLVDSNGKNVLSESSVYRNSGTANQIEETWTVLPGLFDRERPFGEIIPDDVRECLQESGFTSQAQMICVAMAAREYKLHREKAINIEQALVKYHAEIIDGKQMAPWTGTFPALSAFAPKKQI